MPCWAKIQRQHLTSLTKVPGVCSCTRPEFGTVLYLCQTLSERNIQKHWKLLEEHLMIPTQTNAAGSRGPRRMQ